MSLVKIGALTVVRHLNESVRSFRLLLADLSEIRYRRFPQNVKKCDFKVISPLYYQLRVCLVYRHTQPVPVAMRSEA